ncbi:Salivary glue protein Sgs-3 [Anabarilius grahami]|uniref:Salivary glue protein Sgs-3 n=1 Tax=Anabarilius grahami TaxID=495550 RepID=A0A3N0YXJ9_ANAGA|nr:Salivary glue protein Sgs-3 [Anabarilius grahami]
MNTGSGSSSRMDIGAGSHTWSDLAGFSSGSTVGSCLVHGHGKCNFRMNTGSGSVRIEGNDQNQDKTQPTEQWTTKAELREQGTTKVKPTEQGTTKAELREQGTTKVEPTEQGTTKAELTEQGTTKAKPTEHRTTKVEPTE